MRAGRGRARTVTEHPQEGWEMFVWAEGERKRERGSVRRRRRGSRQRGKRKRREELAYY